MLVSELVPQAWPSPHSVGRHQERLSGLSDVRNAPTHPDQQPPAAAAVAVAAEAVVGPLGCFLLRLWLRRRVREAGE